VYAVGRDVVYPTEIDGFYSALSIRRRGSENAAQASNPRARHFPTPATGSFRAFVGVFHLEAPAIRVADHRTASAVEQAAMCRIPGSPLAFRFFTGANRLDP